MLSELTFSARCRKGDCKVGVATLGLLETKDTNQHVGSIPAAPTNQAGSDA